MFLCQNFKIHCCITKIDERKEGHPVEPKASCILAQTTHCAQRCVCVGGLLDAGQQASIYIPKC